MCGRYVITGSIDDYVEHFAVDVVKTEALAPNYNVAPTDPVYAVAERKGERQLGVFRWGLIPHWAGSAKGAARFINARAETVQTKPAFRDSFRSKRCLVPADGFYEWEKLEDGRKLPHYFFSADRTPVAFAGLWAAWQDPATGEWVRTCAIVTTDPNRQMRPIHDRMPALLPPQAWDEWLDRDNEDAAALMSLLGPPPEDALDEYAVSTLVNSVKNNLPELVEPLH